MTPTWGEAPYWANYLMEIDGEYFWLEDSPTVHTRPSSTNLMSAEPEEPFITVLRYIQSLPELPDNVKYIAQDGDGILWGFSVRPYFKSDADVWYVSGGFRDKDSLRYIGETSLMPNYFEIIFKRDGAL